MRPTSDHFKKHILRVVKDLKKEIVWDLFAGSGNIGLELLSAGSREVVWVEQLKRAVQNIELNIAECRLRSPETFQNQKTHVICASVNQFLKDPFQWKIDQKPDLIFMDPPYGESKMTALTEALAACSLAKGTKCLVEHVSDDPLGSRVKILFQENYGPKQLSCFLIDN